MTRLRRTLLTVLALLAAVAVLAGCGGPADPDVSPPSPTAPPSPPPVQPPTGPAELVLQLREARSPVPPGASAALPRFSLFGDGRLVVPADTAEATPAARELRVSAAAVRDLTAAAVAAGLAGADLGLIPVADGPVTRYELSTGGRVYIGRVAAADVDPATVPAEWLSPDQRRWREQLRALRARLARLAAGQGAELTAGPVPYHPRAVAALLLSGASEPSAGEPVRDWPVPDQGLDGGGVPAAEGTCLLLTGAAVDRVGAAAAGATRPALWRDGTDTERVLFRPLLPGESDCEALQLPE